MPPVVPRKRLRSDSPDSAPLPPLKRTAHPPQPRRSKDSVFRTLDAAPNVSRTLSQTKKFLGGDSDDSDPSSPDSSDEDEFEDVPITSHNAAGKSASKQQVQEFGSDGSEDEEWEDALGTKHHTKAAEDDCVPLVSGDISLTLSGPNPTVFAAKPDGKKGPSKIQRHIRSVTHCMHVQCLMFHNTVRNSWVQDKEVQRILVAQLSIGCWKEIERFWRDSGIRKGWEDVVEGGWTDQVKKELENAGTWKASGKNGVQVYESPKAKGPASMKKNTSNAGSDGKTKSRTSDRNQRDWGASSDRLEPDTPNLSTGEPLLRLLKYLSAYWKGRFKINAPPLRKRGYLSPAVLEAEIRAWRDNPTNADIFGEQIVNIAAFRDIARKCSGSRDVGQQLFTSLLRGLGIEARMVASLQPVGFGWSQAEEGKEKDLSNPKRKLNINTEVPATPAKQRGKTVGTNGTQKTPINLSDSDDLSSAISISSDSDASIKPSKKSPRVRKYGEELPYPTYWTEAISTLTHTPIAVTCLPRIFIATSSMSDQMANFYSRGAAADKAKQVFAYILAFSSDGTAKDVTTRYLPKHQWPGRTKGFRMAVEKIPIHNKRGKVKRWEEWDWFKSVLRPYARPHDKRKPWDEVEDEGDLVPRQPAKPKDMDEEGGKETMQGYKNSAEYVLERHLRREEAIRPGAKIVRHFKTGKGDKERSEPVYRREDIVTCKSVESWHKEGRAVREGEQPLKFVPMRAVTVIRKREIEEREREEGEKVKQGLYSEAQTDWIIPDPIVDGKIPRNAFGNIDVYVPTMVPKGAVHVRLKGTAKICRKLGIDYAEACTGFEFGKQRAVPVLTGVVVAEEHENLLIDAWKAAEAAKEEKEQSKREKQALGMWKKFLVGLRIVQRMRREYGDASEQLPMATETEEPDQKKSEWDTFRDHEDFEGGFVRDEQPPGGGIFLLGPSEDVLQDDDMAGGFLAASQESIRHGALTIDGEPEQPFEPHAATAENAYRTPISLHSAHQGKPDEDDSDDLGSRKDDDEEAPAPSSQPTRGKTQSNRGRGRSHGRGRGTQRASAARRKSITEPPSDTSALSDPSPDILKSESEAERFPRSRRAKRQASNSPQLPPESADNVSENRRTVPRRKAAQRSSAQVKSHYFANASDEETDLTDRGPAKKRIDAMESGTRGRGRGRGNGRGRARRTGR